MRLFVALDIDAEIRQGIAEFREQVRAYAPDVRWVDPSSFHITLQFLGDTERVEEIRAALQHVRGEGIPLTFRGTGFFPNPRAPRVFWVGIESDQRLQRLADAVGEALKPPGFQREAGAFTPHLTLARLGSGRPSARRGDPSAPGLGALRVKLETLPPAEFGTMTAREFCLYQSTLSPKGSKYTKLATYQLA
jgi:2'-5' RNA ligase